MPVKEKSRRQEMMDRVNPTETLDPTPIDIPLDALAPGRAIEDLVQQQIRMHLEKKTPVKAS